MRPNSIVRAVGDRVGWVILLELISRPRRRMWRCKCDCGKIFERASHRLERGHITSCGCWNKKNKTRYSGSEANLRNLYYAYHHDARKRNHVFALTLDEFQKLTSSNCYYCNSSPSRLHRAIRNKTAEPYLCNGVDRKNNSLGYTSDNVVPCCATCNAMKSRMSVQTFLLHVQEIHRYRGEMNAGEKR